MSNFLSRNYKSLIIGGVITTGLTFMLNMAGLMIVNPTYVSESVYILLNILAIVFGWAFVSFLVYKFPIYKVLSVVGLLVGSMLVERFMKIPFNPITFSLLLLFWLGVVYFILPQFFEKYKIAIFSVYGAVLSYLFVFRMQPDYEENYHENFLNFILIPIPVFAVLWIYEQWRWMRMLKSDKAKAELALLKSQVNPHFFFNTLNNLYGLVVEKSPQAPEVVLKLSDMMRYNIYNGKEELVSLADEVNYLETYIELHKMRYQKKVDIRFVCQINKEVQVAPLLFIILLENAFKHGVEKLTENAYVHLDLEVKGDQVRFTVKNNYETNTPNQKAGIGLDNLKKRLVHIYPNRHELRIEKTDATYIAQLNLSLQSDLSL